MIKVCHISTAHAANDQRIFHKECVSLSRNNFDVSLIISNPKDEIIKGVKIIDIPKLNRLKRFLRSGWRAYRKAKQVDADIYHIHDPELLPFALLLKWRGKKIIYDVHEDLPKQILSKHWINPVLRKSVAFFTRKFENFVSRRMTAVITATPKINERFLKLNSRSVNINNFPFPDELENINTEWSQKKNEICYIGGITAIRGVLQLLEAMSITENVNLNMGGEFNPSALKETLQQSKGWEKVKYHGFVNREKMSELLARSKAGLVTFLPEPNHIDAQPNKMFEYMSAGIPVIASHFPLWKEIIEGNHCGICVDPENPTAIAEAINYIITHNHESEQMGLNGSRAVKEKYNWLIEEKKLIALYQSIS